MKKSDTAILATLSSLCLWGSGSAVLKAQADDLPDKVEICQLMQMERGDVYKLEVSDPPPKADKSKDGQSPQLDVTPVISWVDPNKKLKAVFVCVHGLGLHKGSYTAFGERMSKDGYGVYAMDVRGFGEFQELPGNRKCDFDKCLDDVCEGLKLAHTMHPGVPVIILGESMGGAIAMRVTEEHPELMDGLVSSVPGATRHKQLNSALQVGMKLITGGTNAKVNVGKSVVAQSTQKEDLRKEWSEDKLARFELTALELMQFQNFMQANKKNADKITSTPVLMVQGKKDKLVKQEDDDGEHLSTFGKIKTEDKMLIMVDNAEHLIFEEGQFDEPDIKTVSAWVDSHFAPKNAAIADR